MTDHSTREYIITALLTLLEKTSFEDITVKQIVEKTGISRSTFYLHFKGKYDLKEELTKEITEEFVSYYDHPSEELEMKDPDEMIRAATLNICRHILKYKIFYKEQFHQPNFMYDLSQKLAVKLFNVFSNNGYAIFASYGTVGYLSQWVHDGFKISPVEASIELTDIGVTNWAEFYKKR